MNRCAKRKREITHRLAGNVRNGMCRRQPFFPIRPLKSPILPIADTAHQRVLVAVAERGAGRLAWWGWPPLRSCGWFGSGAAARRHRTACAADVPWRRAAQLLSNGRAVRGRVRRSRSRIAMRHVGIGRARGTLLARRRSPPRDEPPIATNVRGNGIHAAADNSFAGVEKCVAGGMTARAAGAERSS